jgi:hypothetical protein
VLQKTGIVCLPRGDDYHAAANDESTVPWRMAARNWVVTPIAAENVTKRGTCLPTMPDCSNDIRVLRQFHCLGSRRLHRARPVAWAPTQRGISLTQQSSSREYGVYEQRQYQHHDLVHICIIDRQLGHFGTSNTVDEACRKPSRPSPETDSIRAHPGFKISKRHMDCGLSLNASNF